MEVLLNDMDDVKQQLTDHEHSLLSHDTMASDRDTLRSLHNQLRVNLRAATLPMVNFRRDPALSPTKSFKNFVLSPKKKKKKMECFSYTLVPGTLESVDKNLRHAPRIEPDDTNCAFRFQWHYSH